MAMKEGNNGGVEIVEPTHTVAFDLSNRDPHQMNQILRLGFTDIIAEPGQETYSKDATFQKAYETFSHTKTCWYQLLTTICAIPVAFCLGLHFGCISFNYIWCFRPWLKGFEISMYFLQKVYSAIVSAFLVPLFNATGRVLSRIRVLHANSPDPKPLLQDV